MILKSKIKLRCILIVSLLLLTTLGVRVSMAAMPVKPISQLFSVTLEQVDQQSLRFRFHVAPGYYLYKKKLGFYNEADTGMVLGKPLFDAVPAESMLTVHQQAVFKRSFTLRVPIVSVTDKRHALIVTYQGCSAFGLCYPPQKKVFDVRIKKTSIHNAGVIPSYQQALHDRALIEALVSFFIIGVVFAFTPCVWPMYPVLLSILLSKRVRGTGKSLAVSCCYVLGIGVSYALIGVLFAYLGMNVQLLFQSYWLSLVVALLLVAIAVMVFFGWTFSLPPRCQAALDRVVLRQRKRGYIGVFLMGLFASLALSPCVTPPLAAILLYVGHDGHLLLGGLSLFVLGLGLGLPLIMLSMVGAKCFPKSGVWLDNTRYVLGVTILLMALVVASKVISLWSAVLLSALILLVMVVILWVVMVRQRWLRTLLRGGSVFVLLYALSLLASLFLGYAPGWRPFQARLAPPPSILIDSVPALRLQLGQARGRPVVIYFHASWCHSCVQIDAGVLTDSAVQKRLLGYQFIRVDVTRQTAAQKALMAQYQVIAPPAFRFIDPDGRRVASRRVDGEVNVDALMARLSPLP